jgi:hypothetical protein
MKAKLKEHSEQMNFKLICDVWLIMLTTFVQLFMEVPFGSVWWLTFTKGNAERSFGSVWLSTSMTGNAEQPFWGLV